MVIINFGSGLKCYRGNEGEAGKRENGKTGQQVV